MQQSLNLKPSTSTEDASPPPGLTHPPMASADTANLSIPSDPIPAPISEVPERSKGRGNKLINIKTGQSEKLHSYTVITDSQDLFIASGRKNFPLMEHFDKFYGTRAQRGVLLPPSYRRNPTLNIKNKKGK